MRLWNNPEEPLWSVVESHLEEADFLVECWRAAIDEPDMTLRELATGIEARLLLHLEGLAVASPAALHELLWPTMLDREAEVPLTQAASLVILEQGEHDDFVRLLALLDEHTAGDDRWTGVVAALGLSRRPDVPRWLLEHLDGARGPRLAGIAEALAQRRAALGPALTPLLASDDPVVLRAAAKLACSGDAAQLQTLARLGTHHRDSSVVAEAVQTCMLRDVGGALDVARYWAFDAATCEFRRSALLWMSLFGQSDDQRRVLARIDDPEQRPHALWAAGFSGRVAAVDAAIAWLGDEDVGPLAAEVVAAIAGLPVDDETLWRDRPTDADEDVGLPDLARDNLDANLVPDPETLLPVPEPAAVAAWWQTRRGALDPDRPLLAGQLLDDASLIHALIEQPLRRRHALALLAQYRSRQRGEGPLRLATRDWAHAQLRELDLWSRMP